MVGTMHVTITNRAVLEHALVVGGTCGTGSSSPTSTPRMPSTRPGRCVHPLALLRLTLEPVDKLIPRDSHAFPYAFFP